MFRERQHCTTTGLLVAGLLTTLALAACSGGGGQSTSSAAKPAVGAPAPGNELAGTGRQDGSAPSGAADGSGSSGAADGSKTSSGASADTLSSSALLASKDALARRATIALQVKNIGQAVARVRAATAAADGLVLSENIGTGTGIVPLDDPSKVTATTYGEITVSVPSSSLDSVIDEFATLGTVIRSQSSSENVGGQIIDTESRLKTMRASVDRVRALMARATDIGQIVALESELSRRQADLEALESQLASLKDAVARSPIQVSLTTEPGVIARPADTTGFLAGLKAGWQAFTASVVLVLMVLGAVLPFAVVVALLALPLWWYLRRRRAATHPPTVVVS